MKLHWTGYYSAPQVPCSAAYNVPRNPSTHNLADLFLRKAPARPALPLSNKWSLANPTLIPSHFLALKLMPRFLFYQLGTAFTLFYPPTLQDEGHQA